MNDIKPLQKRTDKDKGIALVILVVATLLVIGL